MTATAFLFPGQGSQVVGMGAALCQASAAAAAVFAQANDVLGWNLADVCRQGPPERLDRTDVAQPAIYVTSVAVLAALREANAEMIARPANFAAGLSLGEFTALHYAGAMSFADGLRLVHRRGQLMQAAAESSAGGMVAILGLDEPAVIELCQAAIAEVAGPGLPNPLLLPANFLSPGNIVISGDVTACEAAARLAESQFKARAVKLAVAGAFHTPHMDPAAAGLAEALAATAIETPTVTVLSNVGAAPHGEPSAIRAALVAQLNSPVLWEQTLRRLLDEGVTMFYELGAGRVLAGLLKRVRREARIVNLHTPDDLAKLSGAAT